ncbi:hypothetical protein PSTT_11730 [Puccinia striiformis]|uniref:Purple acid phosphatase n=1 Tax=Puccinia striiformis TaxID=27350 RepID=A0A2S4UZ11_9BASI|nr:hypothetical protein PSTT_11730 [Puccinia striiformis]
MVENPSSSSLTARSTNSVDMLRNSPNNNNKRNSSASYLPFGAGRSDSPPELPGYHSNRRRKSSRPSILADLRYSRFLPTALTRSSSLPVLIILFLLVLLVTYWLFNTVLILFRFKIADGLLSSGWIGIGLKIRKPPLIFVHSSQSAAIVWESNKMASSSGHQLGLRYWKIGPGYENQTISLSSRQERLLKLSTGTLANVKRTRPEGDDGWRRWVHTAVIEGLEPSTTYAYEIVLLNNHFNQQHTSEFEMIKKIYSKHRFTWYGIDQIDLSHGNRLSETSPSSSSSTDILHVVVIGDNQFGVRPFRKIVNRFMKIKAYIPSIKSIFKPRLIDHHHHHQSLNPAKPNMVFHLGDAVQDPHNLKQWQTDFWDALTFKNKLASEIPIVYAKGNHDFDSTGHNIYSGGIPKVQIGEMNRTQTLKLNSNSGLEIPGIAEADKSYTTFKSHERDPRSRGTYFAYSPHQRVRVIVCDSNLEPTRKLDPQSTLTEVDEHERWLLWEMARPEWKEASIRIIIIHVPPFIEHWEKQMWTQGHESAWGAYVRTRFAPHFHAVSPLTSRYDIPPASLVISGGAGGTLDKERVEDWDMSSTLESIDEWQQDWLDSKTKRLGYKDLKLRVYKSIGSQLVCQGPSTADEGGTDQHGNPKQVWKAGHYLATDRLVWNTRSIDGKLLDRYSQIKMFATMSSEVKYKFSERL